MRHRIGNLVAYPLDKCFTSNKPIWLKALLGTLVMAFYTALLTILFVVVVTAPILVWDLLSINFGISAGVLSAVLIIIICFGFTYGLMYELAKEGSSVSYQATNGDQEK